MKRETSKALVGDVHPGSREGDPGQLAVVCLTWLVACHDCSQRDSPNIPGHRNRVTDISLSHLSGRVTKLPPPAVVSSQSEDSCITRNSGARASAQEILNFHHISNSAE